jgi:uncharacterized membrane protein YbhN (UPF0104 family)
MPAPAATAPELALPALDVRALARRAVVPIAVVGIGATAVAAAGGPLHAFASALERAFNADPRWVVAAAGFELLSFVGYIVLLWLVGGRATPRLGLSVSAQVTFGGAAATRLLPTGGIGGVALTIWALRRAGLGGRDATRTLLAFLVVLYSIFLGSIVAAGGMLALGLAPGDGPLALSAVPAAGAALAIAGALALAARRRASDEPIAVAPVGAGRSARAHAGVRNAPGALGAAVRDAIALVRSGDLRVLGAVVWWGLDVAVLWAMLQALGAPPPFAVVVLGYFVGQIANTLPIPGAVSSGMVGVLLAFGVDTDLALASVLGYRAVAIWLPAPIGLAALGRLRRTVARWDQEDAPATPTSPSSRARADDRDRCASPLWPDPEPAMQVAA